MQEKFFPPTQKDENAKQKRYLSIRAHGTILSRVYA